MALGKIKNDQLRKQDEIRRMEKAHNFLAEAVRKRAPAENLTSIEYLKKQEEELQERDKNLRKQLDDNADSIAKNKRLQLCSEKKLNSPINKKKSKINQTIMTCTSSKGNTII